MAKIGEGKSFSKGPDHHKEMERSVRNFRQYLEEYKVAQDERDKSFAIDRMSNEISLMDLAAQNLRKESRVQEHKLSKNFNVFENNPSENNAGVIEQDLNTLKESLEH